MPSPNAITLPQLSRRIGTPTCPTILDICLDADFALDPRVIPTARRVDFQRVDAWAGSLPDASVVVVCQKGKKLSQGVAALLRLRGYRAEYLQGGVMAWAAAGLPLIPAKAIPGRADGPTRWVTRHRPKIDRIACPWLIRRFVDPQAEFLFVAPAEVAAVAERFDAVAFDIEGAEFSHQGPLCSFDTLLRTFQLDLPPLRKMADIVRAADTNTLSDVPEAAGLLAFSVGLSRMYSDDLAQLEAGMALYDALYRWARDGQSETHDWPGPDAKAAPND